jgi:hypothetical protein
MSLSIIYGSKRELPHPNMLSGRFLGIARTVGDSFTFYILTDRQKKRNVVLTRSVIRKCHPSNPSHYANNEHIAPLHDDERDEDLGQTEPLTNNICVENISDVILSQNTENMTDVDVPYKPDYIPLKTLLLAQHVYDRNPEEILIEGNKIIDVQARNTGETIIHFEDGSYKNNNTEDVYNHMDQEYKCDVIKLLICPKYSENMGKLYIEVEWRDAVTMK